MKPISELENRILNLLETYKELPTAPYDITENNLISYMHGYVEVTKKKSFKLDTAEYRYTRKLAGLTLLKHNLKLGSKVNEIKAGIVYIVENEIFPEHYKIGMCVDIEDRLKSYQTYDPFRRYKTKHYDFVLNRRGIESRILNSFKIELEQGEWCLRKRCIQVFKEATQTYEKVLAPIRG